MQNGYTVYVQKRYHYQCTLVLLADNNDMILSIGLGVSGLVTLILVTIAIGLFYLRKKQELQKKQKRMERERKRCVFSVSAVFVELILECP